MEVISPLRRRRAGQKPPQHARRLQAPVRIGKVHVDRVPPALFLESLKERSALGPPLLVSALRTRDLLRAQKDNVFRRLLMDADYVLGAGTRLGFFSPLGRGGVARLRSPRQFVDLALRTAIREKWRVLFLGNGRVQLFQGAHEACLKYPALKMVGAFQGLSSLERPAAALKLLARINQARPDVVLCASDNPEGEAFPLRFKKELQARAVLSVWGGFQAGFKARFSAPASTLSGIVSLFAARLLG